MPQMGPLNWLILMVYFFLLIYMTLIYMSYSVNYKVSEGNSKIKFSMYMFKW